VPIAREFGAAVVVGCIDEDKLQAQRYEGAEARDRAAFLQAAEENYGLGPEDIIRSLVFPCATGDEN